MGHTRRGASSRGVVASRAARWAVGWVGIDQAVRLTTDGEAGGVIRTLQSSRAVRAQVDTTVSNVEAGAGCDRDWQVVAIDEGYIVVIQSIGSGKSELSERCWRDTCAGVGVAEQTSIAATVETRVGSRVRREIAVTTTPDTTSSPVVGYGESDSSVGISSPSSGNVRNSASDVKVSEHCRPDSERATVVDREGTSLSGSSESKGSDG